MIKFVAAAAAAALLLSPLGAGAQTPAPPPAYGLGISFDAAKKALAAAEAEAKKNNWPVAIAIGKAVTANNLRRPTKALQDGIAQGGVNLRLLAVPGVMPLEGGVPIVVDGKIIGAIGVSGVASDQDAQVAMAGAAAAK